MPGVRLAGSGGGGGGNDEDGFDFPFDDPGGGGGGGGGSIAFEAADEFRLSGAVSCDGGRGGGGFQQSGAGGGGSGGAIRVRAMTVAPLVTGSATCRGGSGGTISSPGRPGGAGSLGFIRFESIDGAVTVDRRTFVIEPTESAGTLAADSIGRSVGRSLYYSTGARSPAFSFDGSDPATGEALPGSPSGDLVMSQGVPGGDTSVRVVFFGAHPGASDPAAPDIATETGPVTDVSLLDGCSFIRFEVQFDLGADPISAERPRVDSLRIRFRFD